MKGILFFVAGGTLMLFSCVNLIGAEPFIKRLGYSPEGIHANVLRAIDLRIPNPRDSP